MRMLKSSVVRKNFLALVVLQGGNYIAPMILAPYLVRTLGFKLYGVWMFAVGFVIMVRVCVGYGFDLTATRQAAAYGPTQPDKVSALLIDVVAARVLIWLTCFAALLTATWAVAAMGSVRDLLLLGLFTVLGEALFPAWLFQGMETMGAITGLKLGSRVINLLLVVVFVRNPGDVTLVPMFESFASLIVGVASFTLAIRRFKLQLLRPHLRRIGNQLRDGVHIFISNLSVQFYTTINTLILGFMAGANAVAAYALAEKVYSAVRGLLSPFVQAVFPVMVKAFVKGASDFSSNFTTIIRFLSIILCGTAVSLYFASDAIIRLMAGNQQNEAVRVLAVFAISMPFAIGSFLAPMLVVRNRNAALMRITLTGGALGAVLAPVLAWRFGALGCAVSFLLVQIYNSLALLRENSNAQRLVQEANIPQV